MVRRPITKLILEVDNLLKKEKELSINKIAFKLKTQWRTIEKVLFVLKSLKIVSERPNVKTKREERIFYRLNS
jgi:hypothetical protein